MSDSCDTELPLLVVQRQQPLKQLNRIAKRPPVDIEFQDLTYSVPDSNCKGTNLNGIVRWSTIMLHPHPSKGGTVAKGTSPNKFNLRDSYCQAKA
ncbi:hypothetical protein NQ317_002066 [Molorchus minor]|uniref:Uncharacterized protein n=1 Tax=Molorchus minor TaxID=1323400 RepID=A0ABQ9JFK1_9CUCU|nr:hypothetical protein NQ317_002066 [Molorchus minor]